MLTDLLQLDGNILLWIQDNIRNDFLTPILIFITHLGDKGMIWILITFFLLLFKKTRKVGIISAMALVGSLLADNIILKNLVARTRPYEVIADLQILIERQSDFSFPSGHTGSSFASAVVLFQETPRKYGIPALVLAILIAASRLYMGVHYPSDVIAGVVIGTIVALLSRKLFYYLKKKGKLVIWEKYCKK